jgi:SPRY domain
VDVVCDGFAICKTGAGLYRTAFGVPRVSAQPSAPTAFYFEVHVFEDCAAQGMTVGVAVPGMLNPAKLVGSDLHSAGLHSSGALVSSSPGNAGTFAEHAPTGFGKGDRIGVRIAFPPADPHTSLASSAAADTHMPSSAPQTSSAALTFTINGVAAGPSIALSTPHAHNLVPAVSLYSKGSKAVMRCCRADWGKTAPAGVAPYCACR